MAKHSLAKHSLAKHSLAKHFLVVIPGDHSSAEKRAATVAFRAALALPHCCLERGPAWSPRAVQALLAPLAGAEVTVIAYSAGVVGAAAALAGNWAQRRGIEIRALVALDGWLVPLFVPFPVYRVSHDHFTHRTSQPFGMGTTNFYADPAVSHRELWANPEAVTGWAVGEGDLRRTDALAFVRTCLRHRG
jgi:hypothetical protein